MSTKLQYALYDENEQPLPPKDTLPTMYDLPDEEVGQSGMPDIFHVWQAQLLSETFRPPNFEPAEIFTATDMNLYYSLRDISLYKRPDWFAVVGLPKDEKQEMRMSYVMWQEGIIPTVVVELLSPRTQKEDLGQILRDVAGKPTKWDVYQRWLQVPFYITFSRRTDQLRIFVLSGGLYKEAEDHHGRFWVDPVELGIGLWEGRYLNEERLWLRWYDRAGNWIPTLDEQIASRNEQIASRNKQIASRDEQIASRDEQIASRDEQLAKERSEKEAALRKAGQLAARLRELGIDPDQT